MPDTGNAEDTAGTKNAARALRRRRQANATGGRDRVIKIRVSDAEDRVLRASADRAEMTVQRMLVESALRGESGEGITSRRAVAGELAGVLRAMSALGANVNEMAKATNATGELPENTAATLEAIQRLLHRANTAIDRISVR